MTDRFHLAFCLLSRPFAEIFYGEAKLFLKNFVKKIPRFHESIYMWKLIGNFVYKAVPRRGVHQASPSKGSKRESTTPFYVYSCSSFPFHALAIDRAPSV